MKWYSKKVLVTGSEGFIGSHLVEKLVQLGANVTAFVLYNSFNNHGWLESLSPVTQKQITFYTGDIRDNYSVTEAIKGNDIIFHLAALIAIPYSYQAPSSYVDTNIKGTLNVLQACRDIGVKKLIHTSTSETYGTAHAVPIDELHPLQAQSPYSASKIGADMLAESYYRSFQLPVATIRPFNTYGPRQSARAIIPTVITQLLSGVSSLNLGDLSPTRDFTFVLDTVDGFIKVAENESSIGTVINIGSSQEISIENLVKKIMSLLDKDVPIVSDDQRIRPEKSEVFRLCANIQKATRLLGWTPQFSLDEGLTRTIDWISKNMEVYKPNVYNT